MLCHQQASSNVLIIIVVRAVRTVGAVAAISPRPSSSPSAATLCFVLCTCRAHVFGSICVAFLLPASEASDQTESSATAQEDAESEQRDANPDVRL